METIADFSQIDTQKKTATKGPKTRAKEAVRHIDQEKLEKMFEQGLKICEARFEFPVKNAGGINESLFSTKSHNKSRNVEMSISPPFLICRQNDVFFFTTINNIVDGKFSLIETNK